MTEERFSRKNAGQDTTDIFNVYYELESFFE